MFKIKNKSASNVFTPEEGKTNFFADENGVLSSKNHLGETSQVGTGGSSSIQNSNTVYVNLGLAADNAERKIFKTYASALAWIIANGSPSSENLWQIILPAGSVGDIEISNQYIRIVGNKSTVISNLSSSIAYAEDYDLFFDILIDNLTIENINILADTIICLNKCEILDVTDGGEGNGYLFLMNCNISKGDFTNVINPVAYQNCNFRTNTGTIINLNGYFHNCYFSAVNENIFSFSSKSENDITFNHCTLVSNYGVSFTNNSGIDENDIRFELCDVDAIVSAENLHLIFSSSNIRAFEFPLPATPAVDTTLELISSEVERIYRTGNIITKGYSKYGVKIGNVDFQDFNNSDTSNIAKTRFNYAIPTGMYVDSLFYKITQAFLSYSGTTINKIRSERLPLITNVVNTVIADNFNTFSSNDPNINIYTNLSRTNLKDWYEGSFDVYVYLKTLPDLSLIE